MSRFTFSYVGDNRGVSTAEYALIALVLVLFGMLTVAYIGNSVESMLARATAALTGTTVAVVHESNSSLTAKGASSPDNGAQEPNGNANPSSNEGESSQVLPATGGMSGWAIGAVMGAIAVVVLLGLIVLLPEGGASQPDEATNYREAASFLKADPRGGAGPRHRQVDGGEPASMSALDAMNADGRDPPEDLTKVQIKARLAVAQGKADAEYELGIKYANGEGVAPDQAEALRRFRLAAEQGHSGAQHRLGQQYRREQDFLQAYKWFDLSATNATCLEDRHRAQSSRGWVAAMMAPAQIAKAQSLSRAWQPAKA